MLFIKAYTMFKSVGKICRKPKKMPLVIINKYLFLIILLIPNLKMPSSTIGVVILVVKSIKMGALVVYKLIAS